MNNEIVNLVIPLPNSVLSPNASPASRRGFFMKAAAAKKQRRLAKEALEGADIRTLPWNRVRVEIKFFHKIKRIRDSDNAMAMLKSAYDGLIDGGLVEDDDKKHMERGEPEFFIDKDFPRVEIELRRME